MSQESYTSTFSVDQSPREVFDAITDVRKWWTGDIEGEADRPGSEFTYRYRDLHWSKQQVTDFEVGKKVVWTVKDAKMPSLAKADEWKGTEIVFELAKKSGGTEVRLTHRGLLPECECYAECSGGWNALFHGNLQRYIITGQPQPDPFAEA